MLRRNLFLNGRSLGFLGIPNQGKSTIYNALRGCEGSGAIAKTANFDFCTINANKGKAPVVDPRLRALAEFSGAKTINDVQIDITDVAGLIKGAHKGAGLGNQFLADLRPMHMVAHVLRCFESAKDGFSAPDPLDALATIDTELILADLQSIEKRMGKLRGRKKDDPEVAFTKKVMAHLEASESARTFKAAKPMERQWLSDMQLLSGKKVIYVLNVDEDTMVSDNKKVAEYNREVVAIAAKHSVKSHVLESQAWRTSSVFLSDVIGTNSSSSGADGDASKIVLPDSAVADVHALERPSLGNEYSRQVADKVGADNCVTLCAAIEEQVAQFDREERLSFLEEYGSTRPASDILVRRVFDELGQQSFYTVGPLMAHAWNINKGTKARQAAGEIHGDFEKHFNKAKVLPWDKYIAVPGGFKNADAAMQTVTHSYEMQDGDVFIVDHSAEKK